MKFEDTTELKNSMNRQTFNKTNLHNILECLNYYKNFNEKYLNKKYNLKLACFLKGFPHPSGANARKNIQFKENKRNMKLLLWNK